MREILATCAGLWNLEKQNKTNKQNKTKKPNLRYGYVYTRIFISINNMASHHKCVLISVFVFVHVYNIWIRVCILKG